MRGETVMKKHVHEDVTWWSIYISI